MSCFTLSRHAMHSLYYPIYSLNVLLVEIREHTIRWRFYLRESTRYCRRWERSTNHALDMQSTLSAIFTTSFHHLKLRPGNPGTVIKVNPGRVQAAWVLVPGKTDPLILLMLTADIYWTMIFITVTTSARHAIEARMREHTHTYTHVCTYKYGYTYVIVWGN